MANWKLEVGKMFVYMMFPVGLFHYFNQPEYFEEYVIKMKKQMYPPNIAQNGEEYKRIMKELKAEKELERLKILEGSIK